MMHRRFRGHYAAFVVIRVRVSEIPRPDMDSAENLQTFVLQGRKKFQISVMSIESDKDLLEEQVRDAVVLISRSG